MTDGPDPFLAERQAEKMEAVARLAGGIAHELNNLLTAIASSGDMALAELPPNHAARHNIEHGLRAADRAAELTRQLLAFGRRQVLRLETVQWNDVVARAREALSETCGPGIVVELRLDPDAPSVRADRDQLRQVLLNLVENAAEAMPAGGHLTVATGDREVDAIEAGRHAGLRPGHYAWLEVRDTGVGIDPRLQRLIFEPFFTTKPMASGVTGLGLSTVYGIVKQLDGYIKAESPTGVGTTFTVYLPLASEAPASQAAGTEATRSARSGGIVLVAEDETSVRDPVRRALERFGYRVIDASDGDAALALVQAGGEPIDLLLTDVVMPGMGGGELAHRLRQLQPNIRVVFMSGYSTEAIATHGVLAPGSAFLQKPFSVTELVERVRQALGSVSSP